MRAIACLMVVVFHSMEAWGRVLHADSSASDTWPNGAAGVDLFFVISGLVMVVSTRRQGRPPLGWKAFARHRLERILPLYWLFSGLKLLQMVALPELSPNARLVVWNAIATFFFIPSRDSSGAIYPLIAAGWTLDFEMFFYGVFAIALAASDSPLRIVVPTLTGLSILGVFRQPDWPAATALASPMLLEFCMGGLIGLAVLAQWRVPPVAAILGLVVGFVLLCLVPYPGTWQGLAWGLPAAAIVFGAVFLEPLLAPVLPPVCLAIGDASYAIYLIHGIIIAAFVHALMAHPSLANASLASVIAPSLLMCVMAGWLVHVAIEKPIAVRLRSTRCGIVTASRLGGRPFRGDKGERVPP